MQVNKKALYHIMNFINFPSTTIIRRRLLSLLFSIIWIRKNFTYCLNSRLHWIERLFYPASCVLTNGFYVDSKQAVKMLNLHL